MFKDVSRDDLCKAAFFGVKNVDEWQGFDNVPEYDKENLVSIASAFYANLLVCNDDQDELTAWFLACMIAAYNLGKGIPIEESLVDIYNDFISTLELD